MEIVKQDGNMDCGVSCLLSVIRHYGGNVPIEYLREKTNPPRRRNYVHQRVRFRAYLVIAYGGLVKRKKNNIELYFGDGYTVDHNEDYKVNVLESEKK